MGLAGDEHKPRPVGAARVEGLAGFRHCRHVVHRQHPQTHSTHSMPALSLDPTVWDGGHPCRWTMGAIVLDAESITALPVSGPCPEPGPPSSSPFRNLPSEHGLSTDREPQSHGYACLDGDGGQTGLTGGLTRGYKASTSQVGSISIITSITSISASHPSLTCNQSSCSSWLHSAISPTTPPASNTHQSFLIPLRLQPLSNAVSDTRVNPNVSQHVFLGSRRVSLRLRGQTKARQVFVPHLHTLGRGQVPVRWHHNDTHPADQILLRACNLFGIYQHVQQQLSCLVPLRPGCRWHQR